MCITIHDVLDLIFILISASKEKYRDNPYLSFVKVLRSVDQARSGAPWLVVFQQSSSNVDDDAKQSPPPALIVMGLPPNCSVLDLKSRFEIYGSIFRIRIDSDEVGLITYRSRDSTKAVIAALLNPSFAITIDSKRVQVLWATDPLAKWREGVGVEINRENRSALPSSSSSKLLRPEIPLSKHGRGNKLASAIVNTRVSSDSKLEVSFQGREVVAYDDIL